MARQRPGFSKPGRQASRYDIPVIHIPPWTEASRSTAPTHPRPPSHSGYTSPYQARAPQGGSGPARPLDDRDHARYLQPCLTAPREGGKCAHVEPGDRRFAILRFLAGMTVERFGEDLGDAKPRIDYVTHRHLCNAWCRLSLHAGLTYSRRSDDISDVIRADYDAMGYRVLDVRRATEVPAGNSRLIIRPYPWLVFFEADSGAAPTRSSV